VWKLHGNGETDLSDPLMADAYSRRLVILVNGVPAAGKTTLARERFAARQPARHPIHGEPPDESGRWALARPLPIPDTIHVNTTGPVDLDAITDWCRCPP
jgi:hypothetical protein